MPEAEISELYYNDNDVITLRELAKALEAMGIYHAYEEKTARQIFEAGLRYRSEPGKVASKEEEPITKAQLRDALEIAGYPSDVGYVIRPATTTKPSFGARMNASDAVDAICKAKDEPEYKPGDIVQDAAGDLYKRCQNGWLGFRFQTAILSHATPVRPLKKVTITT